MSFPALMFRARIAAVVLVTLGAITVGPTIAEAQTLTKEEMRQKIEEARQKIKEEGAKAREGIAKAEEESAKAREEGAKAREGIAKAEQESALYNKINDALQKSKQCLEEINSGLSNAASYRRDPALRKKVAEAVACADEQTGSAYRLIDEIKDPTFDRNAAKGILDRSRAQISRAKSEFALK